MFYEFYVVFKKILGYELVELFMIKNKLFVFLVLFIGLDKVSVVSFLVVEGVFSYSDVVLLLGIYKEF